MPRSGITKKDVYKAASEYAKSGIMPTQASIRKILGTGSNATIARHLKKWKEAQLLNSDLSNKFSQDLDLTELEKRVNSQQEQIENLSHELIKTEKHKIKLDFDYKNTLNEYDILKNEYNILQQNYISLHESYTVLKNERASTVQQILESKDRIIDSLKDEIGEISKTSIEEVRKIGFEYNNLLVQEKIKNINLNENIKTLKSQLRKKDMELLAIKQARAEQR